jgi:hypothetical protein
MSRDRAAGGVNLRNLWLVSPETWRFSAAEGAGLDARAAGLFLEQVEEPVFVEVE